jgi:hypothetical protein
MTYLPRKAVTDLEGNTTYLNAFIICEDEYDVQFKIVFLNEGIKFQECFNYKNKSIIKYNLN